MKTCTICKLTKSLEDFNKKASNKDGRQSACRSCNSILGKRFYKRRITHNKNRVADRKKSLIQKFEHYRSSQKCLTCDESTPCCLHFHHLDPSKKIMGLSNMVRNGYSWESLMAEISKCVVLCANCHAKLHAGLLPSRLMVGRLALNE